MTVLAIDPGPVQSAYVLWDGRKLGDHAKIDNDLIPDRVMFWTQRAVVVEQIASYGMAVGAEVFATCWWSGRFYQQAITAQVPTVEMLPRKDVKLHLCHSPRANDATIRQALIDRFGGKDKAIGRKASPGPLYKLRADEFQALALGITWWDQNCK